MADRPLIGITMRLELSTRRFYLGRDYCEAVYAAGGLPIHIPLIPETEHISSIVSRLGGVLLPFPFIKLIDLLLVGLGAV